MYSVPYAPGLLLNAGGEAIATFGGPRLTINSPSMPVCNGLHALTAHVSRTHTGGSHTQCWQGNGGGLWQC